MLEKRRLDSWSEADSSYNAVSFQLLQELEPRFGVGTEPDTFKVALQPLIAPVGSRT